MIGKTERYVVVELWNSFWVLAETKTVSPSGMTARRRRPVNNYDTRKEAVDCANRLNRLIASKSPEVEFWK